MMKSRIYLKVFFATLLTLSLLFGTAEAQRTLAGYYSGNFAIAGLYYIQIEIFPDSGFRYQMVGDTYNDKSSGKITMEGNNFIKLQFNVNNNPSAGLNYDSIDRPMGMLIRGDRLVPVMTHDESTNIQNCNRKKFLVFGPCTLRKKKFYLRKRTFAWNEW
jgi:hypothetical protein